MSAALDRLDVRVIALDEASPGVARAREHFAQAVRWPAVDLRRSAAPELRAAGLIDLQTAHVLRLGRKHRWELGAPGAVGLQLSVRAALEAEPAAPLLLVEDDCRFTAGLREAVAELLAQQASFDLAVFGPRFVRGTQSVSPRALTEQDVRPHPALPRWGELQPGFGFEGTHCVLYSPAGRQRVAALLAPPVRLQYDTLLALTGAAGRCRLLLELGRPRAFVPASILSSVQDAASYLTCRLPGGWFLAGLLAAAALVILFLLVTLRRLRTALTCLRA